MDAAQDIYDVIIIGGGPGGLSCAMYTSRAKLRTLVLDRAPSAGALAATSKIANYPGVRGEVPGLNLLETMRQQSSDFGTEYIKTAVMAVDFISNPKVIYAAEGTFPARSVVIATGSMGRSSKIDGEDEFLGRGVSYCVTCDAAFYTGKVAGIVGHNEVAVEEALFLSRFAREVHLISPKTRLTAPVDMLDEVESTTNIVLHAGYTPVRVVGEDFVTGLTVKNGGEQSTMPMEGVFMLLSGSAPIIDYLGGAVKANELGCIEVDCHMSTDVPGVYAVGDVTCLHPKQAIIAAGEGAIAALAIDKWITGRERARVDYM